MPNGWLVSYAKPIQQLQIQPNHRYKRICGRIADVDRDQILATSGVELARFQNEAVALSQGGLEYAMGSSKTDDLGGKFYLYFLYLGDVCPSTHG